MSKANAQSRFADGDVACETYLDSVTEYNVTYRMAQTGTGTTLTTWGVLLGAKKVVGTDKCYFTSARLSTSNTEQPTLELTAKSCQDSAAIRQYSLSALDTLTLAWGAVGIGVTADTNCRVISSEATASVEDARVLGATGIVAASNVYGGRIEASATIASCTVESPGGVVADSTWKVASGPDVTTSNTDYAEASMSVTKNLTAET
jgi:hypothetical protein